METSTNGMSAAAIRRRARRACTMVVTSSPNSAQHAAAAMMTGQPSDTPNTMNFSESSHMTSRPKPPQTSMMGTCLASLDRSLLKTCHSSNIATPTPTITHIVVGNGPETSRICSNLVTQLGNDSMRSSPL